MSKVFSALAVSVDGYITGRDHGPGRGLGDGGMLFDWYFDGDVPSEVFDGFKLSEPSARVFDALAGRVGATLAGRNTYDDSDSFGGGNRRTRTHERIQDGSFAQREQRPNDHAHEMLRLETRVI